MASKLLGVKTFKVSKKFMIQNSWLFKFLVGQNLWRFQFFKRSKILGSKTFWGFIIFWRVKSLGGVKMFWGWFFSSFRNNIWGVKIFGVHNFWGLKIVGVQKNYRFPIGFLTRFLIEYPKGFLNKFPNGFLNKFWMDFKIISNGFSDEILNGFLTDFLIDFWIDYPTDTHGILKTKIFCESMSKMLSKNYLGSMLPHILTIWGQPSNYRVCSKFCNWENFELPKNTNAPSRYPTAICVGWQLWCCKSS